MTSSYNRPSAPEEPGYLRWEMTAFNDDSPKIRAIPPYDLDFSAPPESELPPVEEETHFASGHPGLRVTYVEPEEVEVPYAPTVSEATVEDVRALIEDMRREAQGVGYNAGREEGLRKGQTEGYGIGLEDGYNTGLAQGLEEGRTKGHAEGFEKGYQEGAVEGREYATTLRALAMHFATDVQLANEKVAEDLLALSLDLAKAMLKSAFVVRPGLIVPIVEEAVRHLPSLQYPAVLYLNPDDAKVVKKAMGEELEAGGWRLVEEAMERGSCRIETGTNQIDNSLTTRWERLMTTLGKDSNWIE